MRNKGEPRRAEREAYDRRPHAPREEFAWVKRRHAVMTDSQAGTKAVTTAADLAAGSAAADETAARGRWSWLSVALPMGLVLLFAFVLASLPSRNSDVWRH